MYKLHVNIDLNQDSPYLLDIVRERLFVDIFHCYRVQCQEDIYTWLFALDKCLQQNKFDLWNICRIVGMDQHSVYWCRSIWMDNLSQLYILVLVDHLGTVYIQCKDFHSYQVYNYMMVDDSYRYTELLSHKFDHHTLVDINDSSDRMPRDRHNRRYIGKHLLCKKCRDPLVFHLDIYSWPDGLVRNTQLHVHTGPVLNCKGSSIFHCDMSYRTDNHHQLCIQLKKKREIYK
jgi:hypothetical protein